MYRLWGCLALVLLLPMSAAAQSASTDERDQAMQEMRARIEKLEKLVAELQKERESRNMVATAQPASEPAPTPTATVYNVDIERLLIRYDYNDFFKLSFGRYHTPINYWNTAFHHGLWLQTTIARPEMIRFGGRFQPVHFVGVQAEGNIPSGPLGLGYTVGFGNGRSGNIARPGDGGDFNNNRAWVANLFARPAAFNGLQVGGAVYGDLATPSPGLAGNPQFRELITSAHIVWTKETPEFLAEFAHVSHRNILTLQEFNSSSAYVQVAYRLPRRSGRAHV